MAFDLHPQLDADCTWIGDLLVNRLLLMNDARFFWCILVPRVAGLRDLHELDRDLREPLMDDIEQLSKWLIAEAGAEKINVAALGNQVPQLHIHVIARRTTDAAWPGPVWGNGTPIAYDDIERATRVQALRDYLTETDPNFVRGE